MSRQYAAIPIHLPFEMTNVCAMTQHSDSLFVAFKDGRIISIPLKIDSKTNVFLGESTSLLVKTPDFEIADIKSFADRILVHIKNKSGVSGPLIAINTRGEVIHVDDNTDCFSPNSFSSSKTLAVVSDKRLMIKELKQTQKFEQTFSREFSEPPLSVALSYPKVCLVSHSKLMILDIQNPSNFLEIKAISTSHPYAMTRDSVNFFSYAGNTAMTFDSKFDSNAEPILFESPCTDHTRCGQFIGSLSENQIVIYDFKHHKGTIPNKNYKRVASFDSSILTCSDNDVFILKDFTEAYEHVLTGSIDTAILALPNQSIDSISSLFEMIWNNNKHIEALSLLTMKEFEDCIVDAFRLFEFLVFSPEIPKSGRLSSAEITKDEKISQVFVDTLFQIRSGLSDEVKAYVDTAIVETLSYLNNSKKLCDFFDENPVVITESLDKFFEKNNGVPFAVYLSYQGKHSEAVQILKESSSLDVAARIISKKAIDWEFVEKNVPWLFERAPEQACLVLASDIIDISRARAYVVSKYPLFYMRFLMCALKHKDIISRKMFINELTTGLVKLLTNIKKPDFDRKEASWLNCVIQNKETNLDVMEKEISDDLIELLRTFHDEVEIQNLMTHVSKIDIPRVQVEIYTAAGYLSEALNIVWSEGIEKCVTFCQKYEIPQKAFSCLFKIMKERSSNAAKDITAILKENIEIVDVADAMAQIGGETDLNDVIEFVASLYKDITTERRSKEIAAAFAENRAKESDYQRVVLESGHVSLGGDQVCAGCGKTLGCQYVVRTPNGLLYHYKCLTIQK
ncbi:hypothetical protein TVAG_333210 [Trichomonas vaginalis G3]|uniref:CNH domain-containing protein n=1 Tax=Trichomonas vaginalis (strain ATCC PRA-98 / G3) TaxID=412133 RepID=A2EHB7_TRIV3|nr:CNH domain containing family [Trichomonas vaginalis G3]EAY07996.1 hypothetical protein TVAG_333210 [Trichomonas vaginalis G3]KAI5486042.1 CNH domain containing family [Trichomonas vaginalis G3]|eukprot:XP_001320219.1 hypothetical protein [Trichomonas vaginalis G3]